MIPAVLALLTSVAYGTSDFVAGITSRRISSVDVALWSQVAGAVPLVAALALSGQRPDASGLAWGAASGVVAALGVLVFYRALAIGPTTVVSPIAAGGVAVPVLVGALGGEPPSAVVVVGLLAAVGGVAIVSLANSEDPEDVAQPCPGRKPLLVRNVSPMAVGVGNPRQVVPLALLAAVCFGSFFVLLDLGTAGAEASVLWVALGVHAGSLPTTVGVALFSHRHGGGLRLPPVGLLVPVGIVGVLAVCGDVSLAYATTSGQLGVVSVLASLDILVTVLLARFVLAERLRRLQSAGGVLTVVGVVLISAG
jgi:drug/metabolite transporter (DMT)-like permease